MDRRALVVANWKMHGQKARIGSLVEALLASSESLQPGLAPVCAAAQAAPEIVLCPPFPYLEQVHEALRDSALMLGAQNLFAEDSGAYTGEVSAPMLKDFDCRFVLVGHSERRQLFGETDAQVAAKFAAARRHGLVPVLCVGESAEQREAGVTDTVVAGQVENVLQQVGIAGFSSAVIAYEPVWAIGSGTAATPANAQAVHALIRATLARHDAKVAAGLRILYGGSVNGANAGEFAAQQDIDGALVGGASLQAEEFMVICGCFMNVKTATAVRS